MPCLNHKTFQIGHQSRFDYNTSYVHLSENEFLTSTHWIYIYRQLRAMKGAIAVQSTIVIAPFPYRKIYKRR